MIHSNVANIIDGELHIDRKFLTGMKRYASSINAKLVTLHPKNVDNHPIMDAVSVPIADLDFEVAIVDPHADSNETSSLIQKYVESSNLVYGYTNWNVGRIAKDLKVPHILVLEYNMATHIIMSKLQVNSVARRISRTIKTAIRYLFTDCVAMYRASALHCNGYPSYFESRLFNKNRLLYLDSRMLADMIIPSDMLSKRLRSASQRPLRLLFSGRYERIKGAAEVVHIAIECLRQGLDIELQCYGRGSLKAEMVSLVAAAGKEGQIFINDPIPYPELVRRSYESDVFVCCHIQSDPSCTYLESFGAGLPIVGYGNEMWKGLSKESGTGYATPVWDRSKVVEAIRSLSENTSLLEEMSKKAREFALAHTFEKEFAKRTEDLNSRLLGLSKTQ